MAINATIDAMTTQIAELRALVAGLDGVQPIAVSIGQASMSIDPATATDSYAHASQAIRNSVDGTVAYLRAAIADAAIAANTTP